MNYFESCLLSALGQVQAGKLCIAAVSGGADSTAMLAGLAALREEAGFFLHCVHVEHGIRLAEESRGDAMAVEALCKKLEVPCTVVTIPAGRIAAFAGNGGPGVEGAARFFRYRALKREARRLEADWILTAHTLDDLLETLLMNILKGAGPAGFAPIKRTRGRLLRPLFEMQRQQVLVYLREKGIPFRTDSTNTDTRFFRNRVRLELVPLLDNLFPSWRKTILTFAETQTLTADYLASEVRERLGGEDGDFLKNSFGELKIREDAFFRAPQILREEAVFAGADLLAALNVGQKGRRLVPRRTAVRRAVASDALKQSAKQSTGTSVQDLGPVRLETKNGFVSMTLRNTAERGFSLLIKEPGLYTLKGKVLGLVENVKLVIRVGADKDLLPGFTACLPVVLRNHQQGDRIIRGGHKRRLSDILGVGNRREVITACGIDGPFAFIVLTGELSAPLGQNLLVITKDSENPCASGTSCFIEFGGLDV